MYQHEWTRLITIFIIFLHSSRYWRLQRRGKKGNAVYLSLQTRNIIYHNNVYDMQVLERVFENRTFLQFRRDTVNAETERYCMWPSRGYNNPRNSRLCILIYFPPYTHVARTHNGTHIREIVIDPADESLQQTRPSHAYRAVYLLPDATTCCI